MSEDAWRDKLARRLRSRRAEGLHRRPSAVPPGAIDLATNDYLGLRNDPRLAEAVRAAACAHGVGAGSSRLLSGTTELHERTEARFARFKGAEAAAVFPTGYAVNIGLLTALVDDGDLVLFDKLCHASIVDAARLVSLGGRVSSRAFAHKDVERARRLALKHTDQRPDATVWIVSDSVFSMDGDLADVRSLAALRDEIAVLGGRDSGGACLILDEAHATGVLGEHGAGLDELAGGLADICVSTASKALGSLGGIVTGPAEAIEAIHNFARSFIYTTAVPPTQLAAIDAALGVLRDEPERRDRLQEIVARVRAALVEGGWPVAPAAVEPTPIVPLVVGAPEAALRLSASLLERGVYAPAVRPPSVAPGASRVRLSLNALLDDAALDALLGALEDARPLVANG